MSEAEIKKPRLDAWLTERGFFKSRDRANEAIRNGQIEVNGQVVKKPAWKVGDEDRVKLLQGDFAFVGRGALKLQAAVKQFNLKVADLICLDIGVATGGFSDYLLQQGAAKVYGVDIGKGQIDSELLANQRFVFRNFTDATKLTSQDFPEKLNLIVIDVSFISILKFLPALVDLMQADTVLIPLIKPQYELGKSHQGVVKDQKIIQKTLKNLQVAFEEVGLKIKEKLASPVLGKEGNQEYLWLVKKSN